MAGGERAEDDGVIPEVAGPAASIVEVPAAAADVGVC